MIKIKTIATLFLASFTLLSLTSPVANAKEETPPGLDSKEFKRHKREARSYGFETRIIKDKANDLILIESPIEEDPLRETQRYYIRAAVRDGKVLATQIIISKTHLSFTEYDSASMDYTKVTADGKALPVEVAPPNPDAGQNAITQMSTAHTTLPFLREHQYTGLKLTAVNKIGETEVKIKGSLISGFIKKVESQLK